MRPATDTYKTVDGLAIRADVYRPDSRDPCPVIVFVHGGALIMGNRGWVNPEQIEWFLDDGFAVVSIDYRLAPETKLPAIATDLDDAVAWVRGPGARRHRLDADRLAVVGASAGGYLAMLAGHRVRPRPRAIVSFYGYGDIAGSWYSRPDPFYLLQPEVSASDARAPIGRPLSAAEGSANDLRQRFYLWCRQRGTWSIEVAGLDPDRHPAELAAYCPAGQVTAAYPPTLLLHGDQDTDVPYAQALLMADKLQAAGVDHELITIAGGGHVFDADMDDPTVRAAFERVAAFLRSRVRDI